MEKILKETEISINIKTILKDPDWSATFIGTELRILPAIKSQKIVKNFEKDPQIS